MKTFLQILLLVLLIVSCQENNHKKPIYTSEKWENPEWENPEIFQINREEPRATFYNYNNEEYWTGKFYEVLNKG